MGTRCNAFQFSIFVHGQCVTGSVMEISLVCQHGVFVVPSFLETTGTMTNAFFNMGNHVMLAFPIQIKIQFTSFTGNLQLIIQTSPERRANEVLGRCVPTPIFLFSQMDTLKCFMPLEKKYPPLLC